MVRTAVTLASTNLTGRLQIIRRRGESGSHGEDQEGTGGETNRGGTGCERNGGGFSETNDGGGASEVE